jgi:hypothetical protein
MNNNIDKLTDSVAQLLSRENKDKSLGEVSQELNDCLIEIKELIESNEITYDSLKDEIRKHIELKDGLKPGSIGQLLIGCMEGSECAMSKETAKDISFAYDTKKHVIIPLTRLNNPISKDSYCILYINGSPGDVNIDALKDLEKTGFSKIKIRHKNINESKYKTLDIDDINKYIINTSKADFSKNGIMMTGTLLVLILLFYLYSNKR